MAKNATPNGVTSFGAIIPRPEYRMSLSDPFVAVRIGNYNAKPADDKTVRARWIG
jgi:hypothetical protein